MADAGRPPGLAAVTRVPCCRQTGADRRLAGEPTATVDTGGRPEPVRATWTPPSRRPRRGSRPPARLGKLGEHGGRTCVPLAGWGRGWGGAGLNLSHGGDRGERAKFRHQNAQMSKRPDALEGVEDGDGGDLG